MYIFCLICELSDGALNQVLSVSGFECTLLSNTLFRQCVCSKPGPNEGFGAKQICSSKHLDRTSTDPLTYDMGMSTRFVTYHIASNMGSPEPFLFNYTKYLCR